MYLLGSEVVGSQELKKAKETKKTTTDFFLEEIYVRLRKDL